MRLDVHSLGTLSVVASVLFASLATQQPSRVAPRPDGQRYSLAQAMSNKGQLHTIASDGLAFLTGDFTGDFAAETLLPPGKVSDYFGFRYMRDIDAANSEFFGVAK